MQVQVTVKAMAWRLTIAGGDVQESGRQAEVPPGKAAGGCCLPAVACRIQCERREMYAASYLGVRWLERLAR